MCSRRRTVLTAIGSTAAFGGAIGYWQRRRIRRRNETDDINDALGIELPSVDAPLSISQDHIKSSHHRARDHVAETESLLDTADKVAPGDQLDRAQAELDAYPPGEPDSNKRVNALEAYRLAVALSGSARARAYDDISGPPSDALQNASDAVRTELDAANPQYHGPSLSTVIVQCGAADELYSTAVSWADRTQDYVADDEFSNSVTWESIEMARQTIHDADWLFEEQEGSDQTETLEETFERLTDRVETNTDDVRIEYDDGVWSQAGSRSVDLRMRSTDPETQFEAGRVALAVREQATTAVIAATFDTLEQYPAIRELDGTEYRLIDDSEQLIAEKQEAVKAITAAADAVGDDPLGQYLLREAIETTDRADQQLNRLLDNVRSYDQTQWLSGRDSASLRFRSSAAEARAIPDVIELIEERF